MNRHYSILHISDLHKGEDNNFDCLFASLCNDVDSYGKCIPKPEIIVISGDLAEGAEGVDAETKIRQQYDEVEQFLNNMVEFFLNGDKSRMIIVPGNHDIFRKVTIESMEEVPSKLRKIAKEHYLKGNTTYRWSWDDYKFYKINNESLYATRFKLFVEFYNRFYDGIRAITDCDLLNEVIDLPKYNIAFALYNSCYRIDHLNQIGAISTKAISNSQPKLSKAYKYGRFIVGVWHHNISGVPTQTNYLDPHILHSLMDFHIQLGLYGHQHHTEALHEYQDIFKKGKMTLISSGCLYGQGKSMPSGTQRQYNILEVDNTDTAVKVTLHVREDETGWDIPSWRLKKIDDKDFFEMSFSLPSIDYEQVLIDFIDSAKKDGKYSDAIKNIISIRDYASNANKFIDEFINQINAEEICSIDFIPETEAQVIAVLGASSSMRNWDLFDKTVETAKKSSLYNHRIEITIDDAEKLRR